MDPEVLLHVHTHLSGSSRGSLLKSLRTLAKLCINYPDLQLANFTVQKNLLECLFII